LFNNFEECLLQNHKFEAPTNKSLEWKKAQAMLFMTVLKVKKQQTSNEGGWVLRRGRGRASEGASQQHRQPLADPPSPNSTNPKNSAFSNMTFT
jgi:hypothetical protein